VAEEQRRQAGVHAAGGASIWTADWYSRARSAKRFFFNDTATTEIYTPPAILRHIALALMLPVFPLFLAAYLPGRIKTAAKHPMLLSVKIWATAHLLANGTLVDVLLFGAFLAWAVLDRIAAKRREVPRVVPGAPPSAFNDAIAVIGGLGLYAAFLMGVHLWLIGVSTLR